ncbi:MAG: indole-3-glycerol phosphate synthase TrpC [Bdellovibrionales bacterium]
MTTVLEKICDKKREHVNHVKQKRTQKEVEKRIKKDLPQFQFEKALDLKKSDNKISIIAEVKKASPSKGVIRENFDWKQIAQNYEASGATCISCLTDTPYFQGQDQYLIDVKSVTSIPVLRKDFMIDLYQIYESRMLGADAILIIMAAVDDNLARDMYDLATQLGMSALFEVHDELELERALKLSPKILGVNNRNLKTLDVSLDTSKKLIDLIPKDILRISESGISSQEEIKELHQMGYNGFLIGESLMNKQSESSALSSLLK